jgi:putative FmdB family regulatory protein
MPIYEYKCDKCGKVTEFLENASGRSDKRCAHCGGGKLTKVLSLFSAGVKQGDSKRCHGCEDYSCPHAGR